MEVIVYIYSPGILVMNMLFLFAVLVGNDLALYLTETQNLHAYYSTLLVAMPELQLYVH